MATHPDPSVLRALADAAGALGTTAAAAGDDLLDELAILGDHGTQRAVDDAVDAIVATLRTVSADAGELAFAIGSQAPGSTTRSAPVPSARMTSRRSPS